MHIFILAIICLREVFCSITDDSVLDSYEEQEFWIK